MATDIAQALIIVSANLVGMENTVRPPLVMEFHQQVLTFAMDMGNAIIMTTVTVQMVTKDSIAST